MHSIFMSFIFLTLTQSIISVNLHETNFNDYLIDYKEGTVGSQNFTYYYIYHWSNIILGLKSKSGDADIYISDSNMFPTYEIKSYDIHSATCGRELINIHDGLKSPIAVGIYGYFLYGNSSYILEVYRKPQKYPYVVIDEKVPSTEPNEAEAKMKNAKASLSQIERKYKTAVKANSALSLLEILQLMFL